MGRCIVGMSALGASEKDTGGVTRIMNAKEEMNAKDSEKRIWCVRGVPILAKGAEGGVEIVRAGESTAGEVGAVLGAGAERGEGNGMMNGEEG